jgi:hypothetical protein
MLLLAGSRGKRLITQYPLADYDRAAHLYKHNVANLDPLKRKAKGWKSRHLFTLLVSNYRVEAVVSCE